MISSKTTRSRVMKWVVNGELYSSKNSRKIVVAGNGRRYVVKSDVAKSDEVSLCNRLLQIRDSFLAVAEKHSKPYQLVFKIYRKTRRKFDYINIIQNLCDCMVKVGLLDDDNANELLPVFETYEVSSEKPRVEIWFKE
jgi:Holliday junction resolvase RusA-like endonuclease